MENVQNSEVKLPNRSMRTGPIIDCNVLKLLTSPSIFDGVACGDIVGVIQRGAAGYRSAQIGELLEGCVG